jgi:hypothetical protein
MNAKGKTKVTILINRDEEERNDLLGGFLTGMASAEDIPVTMLFLMARIENPSAHLLDIHAVPNEYAQLILRDVDNFVEFEQTFGRMGDLPLTTAARFEVHRIDNTYRAGGDISLATLPFMLALCRDWRPPYVVDTPPT